MGHRDRSFTPAAIWPEKQWCLLCIEILHTIKVFYSEPDHILRAVIQIVSLFLVFF